MSANSKIEWTDHTFNPWWGCVRVSPGCERCYAETFDKRVGGHHWGPAATTERRFFGLKHWQEPLKWDAEAQQAGNRRRVFCASMADVFEDNDALIPHRRALWLLIQATPSLDWLLLTKRPENLRRPFLPHDWGTDVYPNVWLGTTVENQEYAEQRIPLLLRVPAVVRWLSCEPLLGPVDLVPWFRAGAGLHWVIAGGESGARFRSMSLDWARKLRDDCAANEVAFHFKQFSGVHPHALGRALDGQVWDEYPRAAVQP